ncbi:hypothetical protein C8R44DRAFT_926749 [Mycena epipterygia]|nr:hypothetical protein C8R44DRAFT_926749 [Mycena epipterygia]
MPCSGNSTQLCGGSNRLTVYQAPHPPAIATTCIETSTDSDFGLTAVFHDSSPAVALRVLDISVDTVIVTSCATCPTRYASLDLYRGELHALQADAASLPTVAPPPVAGEALTLSYAAHGQTSTSYCTTAGATDDAPLVAVAGQNDLWALCPNSTASGRPDIVWAPRAGHAHYTVTECKSVKLVVDYCAE